MIRFSALVVPLSVVVLPPAVADDPKDPNAPELVLRSFSVTKAGEPGEETLADPLFPTTKTLSSDSTNVTARLHMPARFILGIDQAKSNLTTFTDDRNVDLLKPPAANPRPVNPQPRGLRIRESELIASSLLTPDGKYIRIGFHAPNRLSPGAMKARVKGAVAVLVGKDEKEFVKKDAALTDGIEVPGGTLKVPPARRGFGDGIRSSVNYRGTKVLKTVAFLDGDGKEIPVSRFSLDRRSRPGQERSITFSTTGKGKLDRCTVRITYFDEVETVMVPVDLEAGPGL